MTLFGGDIIVDLDATAANRRWLRALPVAKRVDAGGRLHDAKGRFARALNKPSSSDRIEPYEVTEVGRKMYKRRQVLTRKFLTKNETDKVAERVLSAYIASRYGKRTYTLNIDRNNFPIDARAGNMLIEFKGGLISNKIDGHKWRATIGEPGKAEKEWLKQASPADKRAWNARKRKLIMRRKRDAVREAARVTGRPFVGKTMTAIINADTRTADVFEFDGFHESITWRSQMAADGYRGTFRWGKR